VASLPGETGAPRRALSIVLPAYNEAGNIATAVRNALSVARNLDLVDWEVVVVDDGSTDDTAAIVRGICEAEPKVRLLCHGHNRGYGGALKTGFLAAEHDLICFTDSDNQFDLRELARFLPLIDRVDVVAGFRINRCDPWFRRLNAKAWNYLVRALFYVPVRDIDCAFKLFRREVFEGLELESVGAMVNTELMVKLGRSGYRVVELGVQHYPRVSGTPRGASPRVIARAFLELFRMHGRLSRMEHSVLRPEALGPPTPCE
jgi:glycosyltransferase involved in cell wall biosynthesis